MWDSVYMCRRIWIEKKGTGSKRMKQKFLLKVKKIKYKKENCVLKKKLCIEKKVIENETSVSFSLYNINNNTSQHVFCSHVHIL